MKRCNTSLARFLGCGMLVVFLSSNPALSQCDYVWRTGNEIPGLDGAGGVVTVWDPDGPGSQLPLLVVGGGFKIAGNTQANCLAAWDGSTWSPFGTGFKTTVPNTYPSITAITTFNGDLVVGGNFQLADDQPANRVARWNGHTWVAMGTGMNDYVYSLAVVNGVLYAAGRFTIAGDLPVNRVARWDGINWQAVGSGLSGTSSPVVNSIVEYNGRLIAGGYFVSGNGANYLAQWDGTDWQPLGGSTNGRVNSMAVINGELVCVGLFGRAGSTTVSYSAAWNGVTWRALGSSPGLIPYAITSTGTDIIVAGSADNPNPNPNLVSRWDGSTWHHIGTCQNGAINGLTVFNGEVIATGYMTLADSTAARGIARWNGNSWQPLGTGFDRVVTSLSVYNGNLIAGGQFTQANAVPASRIARWTGRRWLPFGAGIQTGPTTSLAEFDGSLVVSGVFYTADNMSVSCIASWNGQEWQSLGTGFTSGSGSHPVAYAMTEFDGELVALGRFNVAGGIEVHHVARWNGTEWQPLGAGINGYGEMGAFSLAKWRNDIIVIGTLGVTGHFTNEILGWDGVSWQALGPGIGTGSNAVCYALTVYNDDLIAAGTFTLAGGVSVSNIARWDGSIWHPLGTGLNGKVNALVEYDGRLIAGGEFTLAGGAPASRIAAWDGVQWQPLGSGMNTNVRALAVFDSELIVGGDFTVAGDNVSAYWARWGPNCPRGDMNCDQVVDTNDVPRLVTALLEYPYLSNCDSYSANVNGDVHSDGSPRIDGIDLQHFVNCVVTGGCQ